MWRGLCVPVIQGAVFSPWQDPHLKWFGLLGEATERLIQRANLNWPITGWSTTPGLGNLEHPSGARPRRGACLQTSAQSCITDQQVHECTLWCQTTAGHSSTLESYLICGQTSVILRRRSDGSENILVGLGEKFVPENCGLLPPCWVELFSHMRFWIRRIKWTVVV